MSKNEEQNPAMRCGQMITTYGVGSIVPLQDGTSVMVQGLDNWFRGNPWRNGAREIADIRFAKRLNVKALFSIPEFKEAEDLLYVPQTLSSDKLEIPVVRFPRWYYCKKCGAMKYLRGNELFSTDKVKCPNDKCNGEMVPDRFLLIQKVEASICDFPYDLWVHDEDYSFLDHRESHQLTRKVNTQIGGFGGITIECSCHKKRTLGGIYDNKSLLNSYIKNAKRKPWLDDKRSPELLGFADTRIALRGASNVWRPCIKTSLYITDGTKREKQIVRKMLTENGITPDNIVTSFANPFTKNLFVKNVLSQETLKAEIVLKELNSFINYPQNLIVNESEDSSEIGYRQDEYEFLLSDKCPEHETLHTVPMDIGKYEPWFSEYFDSVSLIKTLKITQALVGFGRGDVDFDEDGELENAKRAMTRDGKPSWLPAVQYCGEGVFIQFSESALARWEKEKEVRARIQKISEARKNAKKGVGNLNPRFVLLHTFAHSLIKQLSYECGYGSSSMNERLYVSLEEDEKHSNMRGVLIYTAAGDTEGSLGGLVRSGKPQRLERIIKNAIDNAVWCSSDPICAEREEVELESLNLAACHSCVLLPETCCEHGNKLLDRICLVGKVDEDTNLGFFKDIL